MLFFFVYLYNKKISVVAEIISFQSAANKNFENYGRT